MNHKGIVGKLNMFFRLVCLPVFDVLRLKIGVLSARKCNLYIVTKLTFGNMWIFSPAVLCLSGFDQMIFNRTLLKTIS